MDKSTIFKVIVLALRPLQGLASGKEIWELVLGSITWLGLPGLGSLVAGYFGASPWVGFFLSLLSVATVLLFVAAVKLQLKVISYETPTLHVQGRISEVPDGPVWAQLVVMIPSGRVIRSCYGQINDYRALKQPDAQKYRMPGIAHRLSWSTFGPHIYEARDIGTGGDVLDLAVAGVLEPNMFFTPRHLPIQVKPGYTTQYEFPLPRGTYEVSVLIGSLEEIIKPTVVRVVLVYEGGRNIRIETLEPS